MMSRPVAAVALLLALTVVGATADFDRSDYWWYAVCPEGDYAATPDKCATCTCGVRPGLGGGDCWQWPNSFCSFFQEKGEKCASTRSVTVYNFRLGRNVQAKRRLSQLCPESFKCRDSATGPWCCPRKSVAKPVPSWKSPNGARLPRTCSRRG